MIKHLENKEIDREKWRNCLSKVRFAHFCALPDFLSAICEWNAIVWEENDEYLAVLPLPFKQKFGIKYFFQPFFCQQLGVFNSQKIDKAQSVQILQLLKKHYLFGTANWRQNETNKVFNIQKRVNYELMLDQDFEQLSAKFNQNRKRTLKKLHATPEIRIQWHTENIDLDGFTNRFMMQMQSRIQEIKDSHYQLFNKGVLKEKLNLKLDFAQVFWNAEPISESLYISYQNRMIFVIGYTASKYQKISVSSLIFEAIIKKNAYTNTLLDFEGGNIPGIAQFYESYGASKKEFDQVTIRPFFQSIAKLVGQYFKI